jgi:hypothetical protein
MPLFFSLSSSFSPHLVFFLSLIPLGGLCTLPFVDAPLCILLEYIIFLLLQHNPLRCMAKPPTTHTTAGVMGGSNYESSLAVAVVASGGGGGGNDAAPVYAEPTHIGLVPAGTCGGEGAAGTASSIPTEEGYSLLPLTQAPAAGGGPGMENAYNTFNDVPGLLLVGCDEYAEIAALPLATNGAGYTGGGGYAEIPIDTAAGADPTEEDHTNNVCVNVPGSTV